VEYKKKMERRPFGKSGALVPVLGQGTWQVTSHQDVVATLRRGLDLGMTHIDTAELYTGAERVVAKVIDGHRDEVYLVSKVMPENATRVGTVAACEQSLRRLRTDHLDCYLLHWNGGIHPIAACMDGMRDLVEAGKIRSVGVSNFDVREMEEAQEALGDIPLTCNQVRYNLGDRVIERDVLPWCAARGVAVVGYSPFNVGDFYMPGSREWSTLERIGQQYDATVRQVVLAFLTREPAAFAIPKASSLRHVEENAGGQGIELNAEDNAVINATFPVV
jgi:diketogulonate reductase-like aldo/keto reductase